MSCFPYHNQNNNDYNSNKDTTNQAARYNHSSGLASNSMHGNRMLSEGYQRYQIRAFSPADHHQLQLQQQQQQQPYLMDCDTCDRNSGFRSSQLTGEQPKQQQQLQQQWQGSNTSVAAVSMASVTSAVHAHAASPLALDRHVYQSAPSWPVSVTDASNIQYERDTLAANIARQVNSNTYVESPMQRHYQASMPCTTVANVAMGQRIKSASCMFGSNRTFDHNSYMHELSQEQWLQEYAQDPTMRSRPCFTTHQTRELEREFALCQYITRRRRIEMAYTLSLTEKQIKTWFQNRRVKERKMKKSESD